LRRFIWEGSWFGAPGSPRAGGLDYIQLVQPKGKFLTRRQTLELSAFGHLYLAELALAMTVFGCTLLAFNETVSRDGLSYYGVHRKTIPLLFLGLSVSIVFLLRAAKGFDSPGPSHLISKSLRFFCVAAVGLLLTPYSINDYFGLAHKAIGTTLFLGQLGLSLYLTLKQARNWANWFALSLQFAGGFTALLSLPNDSLGYQFEGQVLFQLGFFALLNHVSRGIGLGKDQPA
jgi:hypothetical protein